MAEHQETILVVDDQVESRLILEDLLGHRYQVHTEPDGENALAWLQAGGAPDLILLDVVMRGMDGFEVCRRIKRSPATRAIPIIFITSLDSPDDEEHALSLGAEDFIQKPFSPPVVLARVRTQMRLSQATLQLRSRNEDLERLVERRTAEIREQAAQLLRRTQQYTAAQAATITALCSLAEARDDETGNHIRRTQNYVQALAEKLKHHPRFSRVLTDDAIPLLFKSAPLHDIGKVAIPDAILLKPGGLTPAEWVIMRRHTNLGRDALAEAEAELGAGEESFLRFAREIAYCHHERWDGTGYPQGLAGDAIPVSARLMAVADVYDALISRRVYKEPYSHAQAMEMIAAERGRHFDPDVAEAALELAETFRAIAERFSDPGTAGS